MADVSFYRQSSGTGVGSRWVVGGGGPGETASTNRALNPNVLYAIPWISTGGGMISRMGLQVSVANGSYAQLGIYAVNCLTYFWPHGLVLGGNSISAGAAAIGATGMRDFAVQFSASQGALYYLAILSNGSATVETTDKSRALNILGVETTSFFLQRTMLVASYAFGPLPTFFPNSTTFACSDAYAVGLTFARRW